MQNKCFYKERKPDWAEQEILLSGRFGEGAEVVRWKIRQMSQRENEEIWRKSGGDAKKYERMVLAESVVFPDLKDVGLQGKYKAFGADKVLIRMLSAGEYERLKEAVEAINGSTEVA